MRRGALSADEELVLRLASPAGERERHAARLAALARQAGPSALIRAFERQRLLPLFGQRLMELLPPGAMPELEERVATARAAAGRLAMMQEVALEQVLRALSAEGIPAATLKGPRFARAVYGVADLRTSTDLDLMVDVDDLSRARQAVQRLGWSAPIDVIGPAGLPLLHLLMPHPGGLPPVELHWRVHWYEDRFARDALRRGAQGEDGVVLAPGDLLATLLLFATRDALSGMRLTVDAISWLEQDDTGAASGLPGLQRAYPPLARALGLGADHVRRISGLDVPSARGDRARALAGRALADPLLRMSRKQARAERGLMDIVSAPSDGVGAAIRRQLLPSEEELRFGHVSSGVAGGRWSHAARTARRYAAAPLVRARTPTQPGALAT